MRDIVNYEGLYAITSCGKVWSYKSQKFRTLEINKSGYYVVKLYKNGVGKTYRINRLVALAYIPNPDELPQVGHDDDIKEHNYISNLYWTNSQENNNHGKHKERLSKAASKPVRCVETGIVYESAKIAGEQLGCDNSRIGKCCRNPKLTCGGYHWEYV